MTAIPSFALVFLIGLGAFLVSWALVGLVRRALVAHAILDLPNDRSSHTVPTPRGGGWGVVLTIVPGLLLFFGVSGLFQSPALLLPALALLFGVSWYDDRIGASPLIRLAAHLGAAALGQSIFPADSFLLGGILPLWADRLVMVLGWAWFMNLYNFMDGIDGISGIQTLSLASGAMAVFYAVLGTDPLFYVLCALLAGGSLGFLMWNWHPAKIFLGDVGSVPLGFLCGFVLIALACAGHPLPALILPLYYIADSGITITKRALRGEKIWQAHRQHFYQRAAAGLKNHALVVRGILIADLGLILAALLGTVLPWAGLGVGIGIVAYLLRWMHNKARMTDSQKTQLP